MSNYVRAKFAGGCYFFTVVTHNPTELFRAELGRRCLRNAVKRTRAQRPFEIIAFCLLFEHLHCIWRLPQGDADYSKRWSSIKGQFSREYRYLTGQRNQVSPSRARKGEVSIWQRRFWEHQIRDENDLQRHVDYIHYNPVKHGLVVHVEDWPWSTYHWFARKGAYSPGDDVQQILKADMQDFGE